MPPAVNSWRCLCSVGGNESASFCSRFILRQNEKDREPYSDLVTSDGPKFIPSSYLP